MVSYISKIVFFIIILTNQISLFGQSKQFISSGDVFGCRVFIKNNGQFNSEIPNEKTIKYGYVNGDEKVYFTPSGLSYVLEKKYELTEHQREAQEHGKAFNQKISKKYYINMIWENANPNIQIEEDEKQSWYHSYGYEKSKSDCYKKITYKNVYNNIDIEYVLTNDKLNGIKYNVILHPNANINDLKIRYTGDVKGIKIKKGAVIIKTPLDDIIEHPPVSSQKNNIIKTNYVLNNNIISFNFPDGYNSSEKLIIDPWVTSISNLTTNNYGYDVDYDFAGNLYVFGGITTYKIAKYNPAGILQWTFSGVVASPVWTSSGNYSYPLIGNFIVDKFSQKCYTGQGYFGSGTQIVRIDANGLYNNYITVQNNLWQECWDFGLKCSTGEILGFGGTNNANYTGSVINQTTGAVSPNSFNPIYSSPGQDVANNAIDDNGDVFVIYSSVQTTALNNKISKINATLNNNIWIAPSQYNTLVENDNKSSYVGSGLPVGSSNGFNCLAVNANYLFYYDGFNLAAYNKLNGTRIGFISISGQTQRSMGGIAVDDCNNVYVGSNNLIKSYFFNGTTFITLPSVNVNAPTINKYIYDLKLDKNSNLLYASGSGFTGVFSAINSTTCSINQLSISSTCNSANNGTAIGTLTTNIGSPIISYTWTNSSNTIISQTNNSTSLTNTVTNLTNDIYTLLAQINAPCGPIISQTININCIISPTTTALFSTPDTVCVNQSFSATNLSIGTNSNYWTFCQGNTNLTPQAINLGNIGFFNGPVFITIAKEGTDYYAFVTNNTLGALTKLFFGSSLLNAPVATNLGNVSGVFPSSLEDLHIQYESGNWYGIAVGGLGGSETVIRINFGSSLANTPTAISMGNIGSLNYPQRLKIFNNGGNYYGFTTNRNNNTITRLNFGNSIANTPTGVNMGNIGALNTPDAIALVNVSTLWYGYIINEGNNTISRLDFGNSLLNIPIGTNLGNTGVLNGPRGIDMWTECNEVRGLITNRFSNDLLNMNLSSGPTGPVVTTSFGNIANFSFPHSITRFRSGDTLFAFITNVSNNTLSRIYYPGCINSSIPSSTLTTPPSISYNAPGNYYINLLVNEGQISQTNYCKQITVVNTPTIIVSNYNNCIGIPTNISATGATTFTWSTGANSNSITVSPSTTTSYSVTGIIGTCSNSAVSTVSVIPSPTITLTPSLSLICAGQTTSLTASGANSFTWTPSTTLSSNTGSMVTSTPSTTTIYTVTGTANTCTNSAVTTVSVLPSPTITLSPNTSICQGSGTSATITANGATSYTWNSAANLSSSTGSIVAANPNSTETYTVTGTLNSCTNTAVATVSVIVTPTLSINSSSATICPLGSASLTATGATNYTWSPLSTLSSSSGSLVIASPSTTTTYTILGSNGTCTNTAQTQAIITVTNNPIITSSNATICSSTSANLSANGGVTYTWSPATNLNATTGSNVISTPTASIIYTVGGSSALGCIGSASVSVTVIPTPTLTISSNSLNLCIVGQSSTLTVNGASSYTWSPTTTINSINTNTTIATPVNTTIYSVIGSIGFTPNICTSTQTIQINVGASAIPTVSPNDEICFGQSTTIYAIGGNTYHWSPTTGVYKPNDSATIVKPSVTTIYTVSVSKNNICPATATIQVKVDPLPIVNAGKDSTINIDQDIVLTGTGNVNVGFLSPDGNPLICNWCPIVTVHPLESTCYTLEGFNTYGCRNTDVVCITVTKEWDIFIPNAFTPNGDISNDYFIPKGYGIAQIDLSIFDRWGVCIFKETNTTLGWDGKYKGQLCQQGIYVYQVDIKAMSGENTTKTGHVTLLSKLK